jgi:hypothetical protein
MKIKNIMEDVRKFFDHETGKWVHLEPGESVETSRMPDNPSFELDGTDKTKKKSKKTKEVDEHDSSDN